MWSATWPKEVQALARSYLVNPIHIQIGTDSLSANANIKQFIEVVNEEDKFKHLMRVLEQVLKDGTKVVIFCETKRGCENVTRDLAGGKYRADSIHGDKSQRERDRVLRDFRTSRIPIMVATDVASRGIDVKDINYVINYDFPGTVEDYIHRIGRTARAGAKGTAISFFTRANGRLAKELIEILKQNN